MRNNMSNGKKVKCIENMGNVENTKKELIKVK
jgi:hypothetical protein